ncbi:MAG: hypothetical protein J6K20_10660 [Thermoguttaceae bacterium]|nr:hypothetical protein [Thermoguttaceae bacterium]
MAKMKKTRKEKDRRACEKRVDPRPPSRLEKRRIVEKGKGKTTNDAEGRGGEKRFDRFERSNREND